MRLLHFLAPPTEAPGRRRSYHRVIYLMGVVLLEAVLLAPLPGGDRGGGLPGMVAGGLISR